MKDSKFFYWVIVGLQGFQLLGFLTEQNQKLQSTSIPILTITLLLISISAYIDFSKAKNNQLDPNPVFLLAPHVTAIVAVFGVFLLGGYLGGNN